MTDKALDSRFSKDDFPRLLLFGTGNMALALLGRMAAAKLPPVALALPATRSISVRPLPPPDALALPMAATTPRLALIEGAQRAALPIVDVGRWDDDSLAWLRAQRVDVALVACWPTRLPPAALAVPTHGFWNLHPSRLPDYRGPAPLFWQRRDGLTESAVTWHRMDADFDAGPIIAQQRVTLPDGAAMATLDALMGDSAFPLLANALAALRNGTLRPTPQPSGGSYQGHPTAADYAPAPSWTAEHRRNFLALFEGV